MRNTTVETLNGKKGHYDHTRNPMWARGSIYGPLQTDGFDYLCPDCGGYGYICDSNKKCGFCEGNGTISLDDPRLTTCNPNS